MDSLLASYGSDDEDADSLPGSPKADAHPSTRPGPSVTLRSIGDSLPPPRPCAAPNLFGNGKEKELQRNSGDAGGKREGRTPAISLFSSLPPPKSSASVIFNWGELLKVRAVPGRGGSQSTSGEREDKNGDEPGTVPRNPFDDSTTVSSSETPSSEENPSRKPTSKSSSLFAQLPQPSKSLFAKLPPPSNTKVATEIVKKNVVEFKPPVNMALLETQVEDDMESVRKRSKPSEASTTAGEPKALGLAALLPPPKNSLGSGAALGAGGAQGGRRTVMETVSVSSASNKEVKPSLADAPAMQESRKLEKVEIKAARAERGVSSNGHAFERSSYSGEGSSYQPDNSSYYDPQQFAQSQFRSADEYFPANVHDHGGWQYGGAVGNESRPSQVQSNAPEHSLAEVLKKERRKGRHDSLPEMIEVKQADLTGTSKLGEDLLRTTGIAFGPAYKPAASSKDKPSKLHRRKHQIGALYFDMKQNEMNLLDRRAKGNLTKVETQAKYGW